MAVNYRHWIFPLINIYQIPSAIDARLILDIIGSHGSDYFNPDRTRDSYSLASPGQNGASQKSTSVDEGVKGVNSLDRSTSAGVGKT
jgi:hypothetical protein